MIQLRRKPDSVLLSRTAPWLVRFEPVALAFLCGCSGMAAAPAALWFQRDLVGMEVGPTGAQFGYSESNDVRYCSQFDGREIVRRAVAARSEYLVLWVRDGDYAYYDSQLLLK